MMASAAKQLYEAVSVLALQRECEKCRLCEENVGLVYVLEDELDLIRSRGILFKTTSGGVNYVVRSPEGWCSCFEPTTNKCKVYDARPLCCRIYPLDLTEIDGEVWWVIHTNCRISERFQREKHLDLLVALTTEIERCLSKTQFQKWLKQDRLSRSIESFARDYMKAIKLRRYGEPKAFPVPFHAKRSSKRS